MLQLQNISKTFHGGFAPVLKDINLELKEGDFCVIIGSNGSGKSTLLKIITGEYEPDSGSITRESKISSVIQDVNKGTIPEMTLLENMALSIMRTKNSGLSFYNMYKAEIIKQIKDAGIGLENYIETKLAHLSGGQRQMIATIMAINSGAGILLLDEHTSALDPKMQKHLMELTAKSIAQKKLTSLMITHKLDDAIKYGNRLIMLHKGSIVFNVEGAEKSKLTAKELLALFHKYEDLELIGGKNVG